MNKLRRLNLLLVLLIIFSSCGSGGDLGKSSKGELVGIKGKKYFPEKPYGMVLIPGGAFIMGKSDDDIAQVNDAATKTVTVKSFYMDDTEITNSEYRQFVMWVRDSVIRYELADEFLNDFLKGEITSNDDPRFKYLFKSQKDYINSLGEGQTFDKNNWNKVENLDMSVELNHFGPTYNNRKGTYSKDSIFNNTNSATAEKMGEQVSKRYANTIRKFLLEEDENFTEFDFQWRANKFVYSEKYSNLKGYLEQMKKFRKIAIENIKDDPIVKFQEITKAGEIYRTFEQYQLRVPSDTASGFTDEPVKTFTVNDEYIQESFDISRSDYIYPKYVPVYPDTLVWWNDWEYTNNRSMFNNYFHHDAFSDYPVVGVNWHQAKAFCKWRTDTKNQYQKSKKKKSIVPEFRLPTEAEWEYAARGGLQGAMYPWGGPYAKDDKGCFLANFKPMRGDYAIDAALYTVEADAYPPNGYNLYNMSGNVSEWIDSSYEPEAYEFSSTLNPSVNDEENKLKVVRGGSWKDVKYFLQVGTRDFQNANRSTSYTGFRTVHDYLGSDMTANAMTNSAIKKQNNKRSSIK
tara:strand:+ start:55 stop:1770 length:1716 start_codon:yes stop_codon:yes gene_type:complete